MTPNDEPPAERGAVQAGRDGVALLVGPTVAATLRVRSRNVDPGPAVTERGGRIPPASEGSPVLAVVSGVAVPRVTIDGRSSLNPAAVRAAAQAVVQAGAVLAGPLPSEAAAVDLFIHELARQEPDVLILTQPIAGDKLRALARLLREAQPGGRPLTVIYNGPPGYQHKALENLGGCTLVHAPGGGRTDAAPTRGTLEPIVRERLGAALSEAGYAGVPCAALGRAASRAVSWLAAQMSEAVVAGRGGRDGGSIDGHARAAVSLVVAEPDQVTAFVPCRSGAETLVASASLAGTGTVDLARAEKTRPSTLGTEGWLPAWESVAARLPLALEQADVGNLTGATLVSPWTHPADLAEACLGGALVEELLARLAGKWAAAVGPEGNPARGRVIVGTGFGLARLGDVHHAAYTLVNALEPAGVTAVAVDPWGAFLFEDLVRPKPEIVAICVSPLRAEHDWVHASTDPWAIVTVEKAGGQTIWRRIVPGRVSAVPLGPGEKARLYIEPCLPRLDFGAGPGRVWTGTVEGGSSGVVLDGRGRPFRPAADPGLRIAKQREFLAAFGVIDRNTPGVVDRAGGSTAAGAGE